MGSRISHRDIEGNLQKSSCPKPLGARAFIFGMKHYLVTLYQNGSNYGPVMEIGPILLVLDFTKR